MNDRVARFDQELSERLLACCQRQSLQGMAKLLGQGADPNSCNGGGQSALMLCCFNGFDAGLEALLAAGADPVKIDLEGYWPLAACCAFGKMELARRLLTLKRTPSEPWAKCPLKMACSHGREECVSILADAGWNLDERWTGSDGGTPLGFCLRHGQDACARALLASGADPASIDRPGMDALCVACACRPQMVEDLLASGAAPQSQANPLPYCAALGNCHLLEKLAGAGADLGWTSPSGANLFTLAAENEHMEMLRLLNDLGTPKLLDEAALLEARAACLKAGGSIEAFWTSIELEEAAQPISPPDGRTPAKGWL